MSTGTDQQKVSADRIRELNAINEKVPKILEAARQAMLALSPADLESNGDSHKSADKIQAHKNAFSAATKEYFSLVLSVKEALETQVTQLEEAGIVASGKKSADHEGLGALDVAWLNERNGDVGRGFESETMAQARAVVEDLVKSRNASDADANMTGT